MDSTGNFKGPSSDSLIRAVDLVKSEYWGAEPSSEELILEAGESGFGRYEGLPPHVALLEDGRKVLLLEPISYIGSNAVEWPVKAHVKLDGASIPRVFWTLIGGPFEDKYRNASIIHDFYCVTKERSWEDTAHMFYTAMRCSGVGSIKAKIMFYAVYRFGPHWAAPGGGSHGYEVETTIAKVEDIDGESLVKDARLIATRDPGLSDVEALAKVRLGQATAR